MKKTKKILLLGTSLFLFSGCSLVSGSVDGGLFRSDDGGKTFSQKATIDEKTKISSVDVLSLAVNLQNGSEVYIGTKSSGIFKTTDAGEKWQAQKVSLKTATKVYSIAIDPLSPNFVYAAAVLSGRGVILKTSDAGANWKSVYAEPSDGSLVLALAIDPGGTGKIYAGTTRGQIFSSENGGDTWSAKYQGTGEVFKIAIDSRNSNLIYFAVNQNGLLRTKDGGKSFDNLGEENILGLEQQLGNPLSISVDPNQENWVYAGTNKGLFRSKNGGDDWELVKVLSSPRENAIRDIAVNPQNSDEIIYGASQNFYKSSDGGKSWSTAQIAEKRTIEALAYNKENPGIIYAGMNNR